LNKRERELIKEEYEEEEKEEKRLKVLRERLEVDKLK